MLERDINLNSIFKDFDNAISSASDFCNSYLDSIVKNFNYAISSAFNNFDYLVNSISNNAFYYSCYLPNMLNDKLSISLDLFSSCSVKIIKKPIISNAKFKYLNDEIGRLLELKKHRITINNIESEGFIINVDKNKIKIDLRLKCFNSEEQTVPLTCEFFTTQEKFKKEVDKQILKNFDIHFRKFPFDSKDKLLNSLTEHCSQYDGDKGLDLCMNLEEFQNIVASEDIV